MLRREAAEAGPFPEGVLSRRFEVLGLDAVYLAFAGRRPVHHPIHAALQALQPGDPLTLIAEGQDLLLKNTQEIPVASLSRSGRKTWLPRLADIESVRVMAMIRRFRKDSDPEYRDSLQVEEWEVPLVEVVYRHQCAQLERMNNASSNLMHRSVVS